MFQAMIDQMMLQDLDVLRQYEAIWVAPGRQHSSSVSLCINNDQVSNNRLIIMLFSVHSIIIRSSDSILAITSPTPTQT